MKVLVTGAAGFIGAHLARALLARGDEVVLLDNFTDHVYPGSFKRERIAALVPDYNSLLIEGSILDEGALSAAFKRGPFDAVVHLAALPNPVQSMGQAAQAYAEVNILGTLRLLQAAAGHETGQFIFAGSSSVYNDEQTPFQETQCPLSPRSPYGVSKAAAELYCALWSSQYKLPVTVTRFFTVYGPWGRPDMAPFIFAQQVAEGNPVEISTDRQRDFTYIDDVISGLVAALEKRFSFEVINLGRGESVELERFVAALEAAAGKKVSRKNRIPSPGEMRITYSDSSKAKQLLGYNPRVSVEEGAQRLMQWLHEWKKEKR